MSASLVGSEMCIRDRAPASARCCSTSHQPRTPAPPHWLKAGVDLPDCGYSHRPGLLTPVQ
eukprot:5276608-Alexandrium_andersonii.AAC.1